MCMCVFVCACVFVCVCVCARTARITTETCKPEPWRSFGLTGRGSTRARVVNSQEEAAQEHDVVNSQEEAAQEHVL